MSYLKYDNIYEKVRFALSKKRFQHVVRTSKYAAHLAKLNNYNIIKARIGGLIHDFAKERTRKDFLLEISKKNLDPDLKKWDNSIWHGIVGAEFIKDELKINDKEILNSVRRHTTGDVKMTTLDKIVFMSDFLEPARNFPHINYVRQITDKSLDKGVGWQLSFSMKSLVEKNRAIYPKTLYAYNHWVGGM